MSAINSTFPLGLLPEGSKQTPVSNTVAGRMERLIINTFSNKGITISEAQYDLSLSSRDNYVL